MNWILLYQTLQLKMNINTLALSFRLMNTISEGAISKFNETLKEKDSFRKVIILISLCHI